MRGEWALQVGTSTCTYMGAVSTASRTSGLVRHHVTPPWKPEAALSPRINARPLWSARRTNQLVHLDHVFPVNKQDCDPPAPLPIPRPKVTSLGRAGRTWGWMLVMKDLWKGGGGWMLNNDWSLHV